MKKMNIQGVVLLLVAAASTLLPSSLHAVETAFEYDPSLPLVYLNVAVKAGSVADPKGRLGLTNFMGEMLLRGTRSRTKEQIDLALDQMGAKLDIETRAEALIFRGAVLTSQLDSFLKLVNEILTQPNFPELEIRKLKEEVKSGIHEEMGRDPTLAGRRFTEFLFRNHPYGKPVLGKTKDVSQFTRDPIIAHYDQLIRDPLLLVVGSGDSAPEKIAGWARLLGEARPKTQNTRDLTPVPPPEDAPSRGLLIIDKPERTQTQINAGQIGIRMTDPDFFPLYLGNYAFGGGSFSARMMVEIRVKRGWSYGANSYFKHGLRPRSWQIHLFPAAKDTATALQYSLNMVKDLKEKGITPGEFNFAKKSLVNSAGFMYNTPKKRVENKLLERTLDLPDGFMKSYGPELQKIQLSEVNAALKTFLKPEKLAISVLGTANDLKQSLAQAADLPVDQVEVAPYAQE